MRTAILACLPLLVAGCAGSTNAPAKPAPTAAAKPAAAPTPATPAGQSTPARPAAGDGDTAAADDAAAGPRRAPRGAGAAALRSRDHEGRQVRSRRLHRAPDPRPRLLRDPEGHARARVPLGQPDRVDDAGRRIRRPGRRQPRRALGAARPPRAPAQRVVRHGRRPGPADRARRHRRQLRHDPDGLPDRDDGQERRARHRGLAAVHDRGARVQRPGAAPRPRLRFEPRLRRARQGVPDQRRGPRHPHLHDAERAADRRRRSGPRARPQRDAPRGPAAPAC